MSNSHGHWLGVLVALLLSSGVVTGQTHIIGQDSIAHDFLKNISNEDQFNLMSNRELGQLILTEAYADGRLLASIDSVSQVDSQRFVYVYIGPVFHWATIKANPLADLWLREIQLRPPSNGEVLKPKIFSSYIKKLLTYGERNGYPFCSVQLTEVSWNDANFSATLNAFSGPQYTYDTLEIVGDNPVAKSFLASYLNIKPGDLYNEKAVQLIEQRLRQLSFLKVTKSPEISFVSNQARIRVHIESRPVDQFDGLIGFAPNSNTDNSLLLTGEVNVDLKNVVQRGIGLQMHWKSFAEQSQLLKMSTTLPYLFGRNVGLSGKFDYSKFDTSFFTLKTSLGIQQYTSGNNYIKVYIEQNQSALIYADTNYVRLTRQLPISNPTQTTVFGIEFKQMKLDDVTNPRKGYELLLNGNIGRRSIRKDIRIEQVTFTDGNNQVFNVYDSITLRSLQGGLDYEFALFTPIKNNATILTQISGKSIFAPTVFFNDLFRLGGNNSLRGFNEESLVAKSFLMANLEYRYLFDERAFFYTFFNAAYIDRTSYSDLSLRTDVPLGFGVGVQLAVSNGLLNLAYALGRQDNNPILLSQAKIHIGLRSFL